MDLPGDVAFETAGDLPVGQALGGAARDEGAGALVVDAADHHDAPQRVVGGAVAATVEAVAGRLARRRPGGCGPAQVRERGLGVDPFRIVADGDQQPGGVVHPDTNEVTQRLAGRTGRDVVTIPVAPPPGTRDTLLRRLLLQIGADISRCGHHKGIDRLEGVGRRRDLPQVLLASPAHPLRWFRLGCCTVSGVVVAGGMLRTRNAQPTLWDAIIQPELLELPEQLAKVDRLLSDKRFFAAFVPHIHATEGRPSIPMGTYLRLMFLKYRYGLGYEPLVAEVADSLTWRRFCQIPLGERAPHPTTLMKTTTRGGPEAVAQLNDTLLAQAAEATLVRMHKVRTDTTVVEADVAYPTDSGLLAKAITWIGASVKKIKDAGGARRTSTRDRSRSAGKRARLIAANLKRRTGEAKEQVKRITADLADLASTTAVEAERVISDAKRALRRQGTPGSGRLARAVADLETLLERTGKIIVQTRTRLAGGTPPGASRLVSLHDPDPRSIVKGWLGKPVEFGDKAQFTDNADGLVLDYDVHIGNPPDADLLVPAIERVVRRVGKVPQAVTADRGYGDTGIDGINGARTETGHGVLTHNLVHLAAMTWGPSCGTARTPPPLRPPAPQARTAEADDRRQPPEGFFRSK